LDCKLMVFLRVHRLGLLLALVLALVLLAVLLAAMSALLLAPRLVPDSAVVLLVSQLEIWLEIELGFVSAH